MYLTNTELKKLAGNIISVDEEDSNPFDAEDQTKVCSYDLRVGNIFWVTKRKPWWQRTPIDLGVRLIYEVSPKRLWKKIVLGPNESIVLKPGEMILGRTHEKISMPADLVGKINTRSSFARLGLSTACNCDLINPGYSGHVPLELINYTQNKMKIYPFMPLCQIFLMRLDGETNSSYASQEYSSKYINDDGGPSVWWRDKLVEKIAKSNFSGQISDRTMEEIAQNFSKIDDEILDRLAHFTEGRSFANYDELVDKFSRREKILSVVYRAIRGTSLWLAPSLFIAAAFTEGIGALRQQEPPDSISYTIWILTIIFSAPWFYFLVAKRKIFYGSDSSQSS